MKIGIDARLPYYQMGGISRYVLQLTRALAALDRRNRYIIFQSRKDKTARLPAVENFERQELWTPCHHRLERYMLSAELALHGLDVMHSPDFIPPLRGATKHVITIHDLNFLHFPQFLTGESIRYYAGQIDWAVGHADRIIADSEHTRRDLIDQLSVPPEKVSTIHLAADPRFAEAATAAKHEHVRETLARYSLHPGYVLFVGTLEPRKNIPTLLKAYALLRKQTSRKPQLVLVGNRGWLYDDVFDAIDRLGLRENVRHLDGVSDRDLVHLYLAAGVLALPSHYEGFGLPVLEAMHCQCPVVSSNRASLPEVVGEAGILLEPDDETAWAATLLRVLTDQPLRRRMISAGLDWSGRFSWESTAAATMEIYEQLA